MFYQRSIFPALQDHLSTRQITVLTGMRRTGKTTLLKKLIEISHISQKIFFDLERIDNREFFSEKNYETIIYALTQRGIRFSEKVLIGIDEIQLVPNLPSVIKYLYDTYDIKFILTGSSSYYLKNHFSESLAGRKKIFEVYPLTFQELLTFKNVPYLPVGDFTQHPFIGAEYERLKSFYNEYIDYGGFPEVVLSDKIADKKDMISDIMSSYINFDLTGLADIKRSVDVYSLIKLLAVRVGSRLEISKLSAITGMSRTAVENYLHLFEQTYLIRTIPVTSKSPDREIVKARKLFFLDNGMASSSAELSSGSKFENAVFNQLHHHGEVSYFSLKTGNEIDFILNKEKAFEVKESPLETDLTKTALLAKNLDITSVFVIGRHIHRPFPGMIWGGFL
ncbi:MAG: ATP-binding protein [Bacteroidia bacterium]|nr:ATP-binding protein [Bacteroidia bacterium]